MTARQAKGRKLKARFGAGYYGPPLRFAILDDELWPWPLGGGDVAQVLNQGKSTAAWDVYRQAEVLDSSWPEEVLGIHLEPWQRRMAWDIVGPYRGPGIGAP